MGIQVTSGLRRNLAGAYAEAVGRAGFEFSSPQVALVGAFVLVYGVGLVAAPATIGSHGPAVAAAIVLGLAGLLVGIALAWRPTPLVHPLVGTGGANVHLVLVAGVSLVAIGTAAMVAYFIAIGQLPILMPNAEQGRVAASLRGGAQLRVLGLLALPGCWVLAGAAAQSRRRGLAVTALIALGLTAMLQISTANRAPAVTLLAVSVVSALLASGHRRLPAAAIGALAVVFLSLVLLAGIIGAVRLASSAPSGTSPRYPELIAEAVSSYLRVPIQNLGYTLDVVPERIGWRLGLTYLQPVLTALPGRQATFDQDVKRALGQSYAGGGTVPGLAGESYANFGPLGWFLVPLVVAAALTWLYRRAILVGTSEAYVLYAYAVVHAVGGTVSGLLVASPFPVVAIAILGVLALASRGTRRTPDASIS